MFLNFMLSKEVRPYCRVNISSTLYRRGMIKGQTGRVGEMGEANYGADRFSLPYMPGGDMV